jgi:hypothetical protein
MPLDDKILKAARMLIVDKLKDYLGPSPNLSKLSAKMGYHRSYAGKFLGGDFAFTVDALTEVLHAIGISMADFLATYQPKTVRPENLKDMRNAQRILESGLPTQVELLRESIAARLDRIEQHEKAERGKPHSQKKRA